MMKKTMGEPKTQKMGLAAFHQMLAVHGAAMRRWPADQRGPAQALLAVSAEARAALQEAALVDEVMDAVPAPVVDSARVANVVAAALGNLPVPGMARARRPGPFALLAAMLSPGSLWPRAAGLAACTAAGILVGLVQPMPGQSTGVASQTASSVSGVAATDLATAIFNSSSVESLFQ